MYNLKHFRLRVCSLTAATKEKTRAKLSSLTKSYFRSTLSRNRKNACRKFAVKFILSSLTVECVGESLYRHRSYVSDNLQLCILFTHLRLYQSNSAVNRSVLQMPYNENNNLLQTKHNLQDNYYIIHNNSPGVFLINCSFLI